MLVYTRPKSSVLRTDVEPPAVEVPIAFFLDETEYQKLTSLSLESVLWENGSTINPFDRVEVRPESKPNTPPEFPIMLRDEGDRFDRLLLRFPITNPSPLDGIEDGLLALRIQLTFRVSIDIPFSLRLEWSKETRQFRFVSFERAEPPRALRSNLTLFILLMVVVAGWNSYVNTTVHAPFTFFSHEMVNRALVFVGGFFGLSLAGLATVGRRASALRGFLSYPELYLSHGSIALMSWPRTTWVLWILLVICVAGGLRIWSSPLPNDVRRNDDVTVVDTVAGRPVPKGA